MNFVFLLLVGVSFAQAETYLWVEGGSLWQSRNDQRIPGNAGTDFSISNFNSGPFFGYRIYAGHIWQNRHEVRALYAPLEIEVDGEFDRTIKFQNASFSANAKTKIFYKFNSYRITYAYHFDPFGNWNLAVGFTGKVRDAEVRLKQDGLVQSKSNIGFVPLLNFQARYDFDRTWLFRFDLDGLVAPQGRAFDGAIFLERRFNSLGIFGGYRTIEGGADNDQVYSFAWIHQAVIGGNFRF